MRWLENSKNKDYQKEISNKHLTNLYMQHMNKWKSSFLKPLHVISPLIEKHKDLAKKLEENIFQKNWKKYFSKLIDLICQQMEM